MKSLYLALLSVLFLVVSCKKEFGVELEPLKPRPRLTIHPSNDTVRVLVDDHQYLLLDVDSVQVTNDLLLNDYTVHEGFAIAGPYWVHDQKKIELSVKGIALTSLPVTVNRMIRIGNDSAEVPFTVSVESLSQVFGFLLKSWENGQWNDHPLDTLSLARGDTLTLEITCLDSLGNIVGANTLLPTNPLTPRIEVPQSTFKIAVAAPKWNSTSYNAVLQAFPDIEPSPDDSSLFFHFSIADKGFQLPLKLVY